MKKTKKKKYSRQSGIIAALLAVIFIVSGCGKAKPDESRTGTEGGKPTSEQGSGSAQGESKTDINAYGAKISVEDIKKTYDYDDVNDIMPLYNVSETEKFEFSFGFDAFEADVDLYDFVTVHTDAACETASEIYYNASLRVEEGISTLTVSPMKPVLANLSQKHDYAFEDTDSWGNAPIYYLAVHYDLEADSAKKLDSPVIIPFTVKHEVTAPTLRRVISDDGRFSLEWDAVEGAEEYIVYNLFSSDLKTGKSNPPIDGAKNGYDCSKIVDDTPLVIFESGRTTECSFDSFSGADSHSLAEVETDTGDLINGGQNYGVEGEFYVTAVVNGKESGLSNSVATAGLSLPHVMTEESEIKGRYPTPADFPSEVEILNIDGTTTVRKVNYEKKHVDYHGLEWDMYRYRVEGTYIYGDVYYDEEGGEPEASSKADGETGNPLPKDEVDRIPDSEVDTIIPSEDGEKYDDGSLIENQADNTKKHIESGNGAEVENVPEGVYINADSAEEEWLALNLIQGNTEISVEAFPSLQDPYTLTDVFYKVYYQNPYVMGVLAFAYDYDTMNFRVKYIYDKETIREKQEAIASTAESIIKDTVTSDMDAQQKVLAIYGYLVNNAVYDREALEAAEENGFVKAEGWEFEDAFNTYGVLVAKRGVCMSYAYAFRLLCDLGGVDCTVVTGFLDGSLPHAWNMVCIDGKYYEVDCTNNAVNTGIPYYLYQADSGLAEASGYRKDDMFWVDSELSVFDGDDESLEYYRQNGLCPESMQELKEIITENVTEDTAVFVVRWKGEIDKEEFDKTIILAYNELGLEDKLKGLKYTVTGSFIVLINE